MAGKRLPPPSAFKKGAPKIAGSGRKKGTPNKTTQQLRDALQKIFEGELNNLEADIRSMNKFQKWQIINKISDKFLPNLTMGEIKATTEMEHSGKIEILVTYEDGTAAPTADEMENRGIEKDIQLKVIDPFEPDEED